MPEKRLRAPAGAGTIYRRKDGRYEAAVRVLIPNGGHRRLRVYAATRAEAYKQLQALIDRSDKGIPAPEKSWTVAAWLAYWMDGVVRMKNRPRTIERYETIIRQRITPLIGTKRLERLSVHDVQVAVSRLSEDGVGPRSIQQFRAVLSAALSRAQREELVHRNVARLVDLPRYQPKQIHPWTVTDARAFLATARGHQWEIGFFLLLVYGMRRGEAIGLRWSDIDFERGVFHVRQQLQRIGGSVVAGEVKTAAGRRSLPLLPELRALLLAHADASGISLPADLSTTALGDALILTSSTGAPIEPGNLARTFYLLSEKAGLRRITVHQTRHTAATLLKSMGVQARDVQLILGHANVSTTQQLYQHGFVEEHFAALSRVADAISVGHDVAGAVSSDAADGHAGRQLTANRPSDATIRPYSQGITSKENRRLPEVVTADFLGGSGGARTHDILLKSDLLRLFSDLSISDIRRLHTRTRRHILGRVAVNLGRQDQSLFICTDSRIAQLARDRRAMLEILRHQLRRRTYPFLLIDLVPDF